MEVLMLLEKAREAGLTVRADGDSLEVRGRPTPEAKELVERLREHKQEVLTFLMKIPIANSRDGQMNEPKPKRGRPAVISCAEVAILQMAFGQYITTRRGLLNKHYEQRAFGVIQKMMREGTSGIEFVVDAQREKAKWGILRDLGRLDDNTIRSFVVAICEAQKRPESKKTVREWGTVLRWYRLRPALLEASISETVSENGGL